MPTLYNSGRRLARARSSRNGAEAERPTCRRSMTSSSYVSHMHDTRPHLKNNGARGLLFGSWHLGATSRFDKMETKAERNTEVFWRVEGVEVCYLTREVSEDRQGEAVSSLLHRPSHPTSFRSPTSTVQMAHSYPLLARHLAIYDQEFRYGELLQSIADFAPLGSRLLDWSVDDVSRFLSSLAFLQPLTSTITNIFQRECVDGEFLSRLDAAKWNTLLGLPIDKFVLLKVVLEGIQGNCALLAHSQPIGDLHPLVIAGVAADLSALPVETALALDAADRSCASTGTGYCYGQFVVLGFKVSSALPIPSVLLYRQDSNITHSYYKYTPSLTLAGVLPGQRLRPCQRALPRQVAGHRPAQREARAQAA